MINDAAMQALGCYTGGRMLFLGLGTGVGSTLILDEVVIPLELGQLRYSRNQTLEDVLGKRALKTNGAARWERAVRAAVANLHRPLSPTTSSSAAGTSRNSNDCRRTRGAVRIVTRF